jgi:hypothetical protein
MIRKSLILIVLCLVVLGMAACARVGGEPTQDPSAPISSDETPSAEQPVSPLDPIPGEEQLSRGQVMIEKKEVLLLESYPLQVMLSLKGTMPTPCHHLRAKVDKPDDENRISVELYSLYDPNEICIQVIEEFETNLPLGSYPDGTYTIWLNGEQVGEFTQ